MARLDVVSPQLRRPGQVRSRPACSRLPRGVIQQEHGGCAWGGATLALFAFDPHVELSRSPPPAVYDVMGRRVRTLVDGQLRAGATDLAWDGRDAAGVRAGSGLHFAGMTIAGGRHTVRVPLVR